MPEISVNIPDPEPMPPPPVDTSAPVLEMARGVGAMEVQLEALTAEVRELQARPTETTIVERVLETSPSPAPVEDEVVEEDEVEEVVVPSASAEPIERTEPLTPPPRQERGVLARLFLGNLPPR